MREKDIDKDAMHYKKVIKNIYAMNMDQFPGTI